METGNYLFLRDNGSCAPLCHEVSRRLLQDPGAHSSPFFRRFRDPTAATRVAGVALELHNLPRAAPVTAATGPHRFYNTAGQVKGVELCDATNRFSRFWPRGCCWEWWEAQLSLPAQGIWNQESRQL